jgi:hypothetical protein
MIPPKLLAAYRRHAVAQPAKFPVDVPKELFLELLDAYEELSALKQVRERPMARSA